MNIYDYDILKIIKKYGYNNQRTLAKKAGYSLGKINEVLKDLIEKKYLNKEYELTEKSEREINEHKPKNAIILAAGFGMRMVPINNEVPKGILEVYNEPLIERLIKQLHEVGVYEIDIVVGFLKEKFEYLIDKYNVNLVYNSKYASTNNLHSLDLIVNKIENTYILPSDIWSEKNPFSDTELYSWYLLNDKSNKNSVVKLNRRQELVNTEQEDGQVMIGIAYITKRDSKKIKNNIEIFVKDEKHNQSFWEEALFNGPEKIKVFGKVLPVEEVFEIDTYEQLRALDQKSDSLDAEILDIATEAMGIDINEIHDIEVLKKGMTNRSFMFTVKNTRYIMRIPGEGTDELISRENEFQVYEKIKNLHLSDELVYISKETGYKITKFVENSWNCDPENIEDVTRCMKKLKDFHKEKLEVDHEFNLLERINFYEDLWEGQPSIFDDYLETKKNIIDVLNIIEELPKEIILTHVDAIPDNFLLTKDEVYLIDWEYSSMQDPHLDLAMFSNYSEYNRNQIKQLLDIYYEGEVYDPKILIKVYAYLAVSGLLWSNWCEYKRQHGVEFGEYSLQQYRYAKEYSRIVKEEYEKIKNINY